jgi:hypothetical protein
LEKAHLALTHIGLDGLDGVKSILPFTRLLIEHNWPAVERIAAG